MHMGSLSPQKASVLSLRRISALGGQAGVIVLNRYGRFVIAHTTGYMASGYATGKGIVVKEGFKRVCSKE
jgi:isoaspartyl peptidase/L-asparaginase-like protein (Ntn-hydrolase superfamily)